MIDVVVDSLLSVKRKQRTSEENNDECGKDEVKAEKKLKGTSIEAATPASDSAAEAVTTKQPVQGSSHQKESNQKTLSMLSAYDSDSD